jgi:hypothetical protein
MRAGRHGDGRRAAGEVEIAEREREESDQGQTGPSLSTSGETLTIEESMTLRARTETAGHVGDERERRWCWSR